MPGQKLQRGYLPPKPSDKQLEIDIKQEEVENYCGRVPVNRLVLACHGIGQKLAVSNIAHDAACMRLIMRQLSQVGFGLRQHALGYSSQPEATASLAKTGGAQLVVAHMRYW